MKLLRKVQLLYIFFNVQNLLHILICTLQSTNMMLMYHITPAIFWFYKHWVNTLNTLFICWLFPDVGNVSSIFFYVVSCYVDCVLLFALPLALWIQYGSTTVFFADTVLLKNTNNMYKRLYNASSKLSSQNSLDTYEVYY